MAAAASGSGSGAAQASAAQAAEQAAAAAEAFGEIQGMLREALADAGMLQPGQPAWQPGGPHLPAAGGYSVAGVQQGGESGQAAFFQAVDGFVAAFWHGETASLSGTSPGCLLRACMYCRARCSSSI